MKQLTKEIEFLKMEYHKDKICTGAYALSFISAAATSLIICISKSFVDACPFILASFFAFILTIKSWRCCAILQFTIELIEMFGEFLDKQSSEKKDIN